MSGSQMQGSNNSDVEGLLESIAGLVTSSYDYIAFTYVAAGDGVGQIETVTYKTGGSGGTTVATLTLTYDTSNRVASIAVT